MTIDLFTYLPTTVLVAILSVLITVYLFKKNSSHQTKVHTLAFNKTHTEDQKLMDAYTVLSKINPDKIVKLAVEWREYDEATSIRTILNHWERVALGVKHGVYCEEMLIESYKTLVISISDKTQGYITKTQESSPNSHINFVKMASHWKTKSI
jgi:hypothetical protein